MGNTNRRIKEVWRRPEFRDRLGELETRQDFEKRTGMSPTALSTRLSSYANWAPQPVVIRGKTKYFVPEELDQFIAKIEDSGPRSMAELARANLARAKMQREEAQERAETHREHLQKAERDIKQAERDEREAQLILKGLGEGE
jgi:hypothetical protein